MFGRLNNSEMEFIDICGYRINKSDISYYKALRDDDLKFKIEIYLKSGLPKIELDFEDKNEELINVINYMDNILINGINPNLNFPPRYNDNNTNRNHFGGYEKFDSSKY